MTCLWNTLGKSLSAVYPALVVIAAILPWMSMSGENSAVDAAINAPLEKVQSVCRPEDPLLMKRSDSCTETGSSRADEDAPTTTQS